MSRIAGSLRALAAGLLAAALTLSCQAVFGDYKINDADFGASGGTTSGGGTDASGGSGNGANGGSSGSSTVQTGPIIVMPVDGLFTTELGGQATFTIVLKAMPKADVTIPLHSSKPNEGTPSPVSVVFTKDDWNAPQVITVTGVDDTLPDGNQPYQILTDPADSTDSNFKGKQAVPVNLVNIDNETAGITVTPTSGLVTSESGMQDTFTVVLNSKPTADVTIGLRSDNPGEGTVSPTSLVFTADDWMAPQLVTVTGVDDQKIDPNTVYQIVTAAPVSDDKAYNGESVNPPDVTVTNLDNDSAGINVILVSGIDPNDKTKLRTSENGDSATFTVQLNAPPTADVTVAVSSSAKDEAGVTPALLTFTSVNWMAPQLVTVTGVDDNVADGDQPFTITLDAPMSNDKHYAAVGQEQVQATNVDNDKAGFSVMLATGVDLTNPMQLLTDEGGGTATFTIALNSKPSDTVTINLSSSLSSEGTVNPTSLLFTMDNWNAPQVVTVKGVDDKVQDGNQPYFIRTSAAISKDSGYSGLDPQDVAVTNRDNDTAGVVVTLAGGIDPTNMKQLVTGEGGDSATFTVALTSQPTQDVTIALVSNNTKDGTVSPASLKFTAANYNAPQTVTLTGVDDSVADGNQTYTVAVGAPSSKDANYNPPKGPVGQTVTLTNRDNDSAGVIVTPTSGLVTSEAGKTATFTIRLQSQPTADVTIALGSSNTSEGTVNASSAKFTSLNWNAPQTITVTGVQDDGTADGPQVYKITVGTAVSADPNYGGSSTKPAIKPSDVSATNLDDDSAGILVSPTTGLITTEGGGTATFTVALQSRPTQAVKITLTSSRPSEGTVSPVSLNFTSANYNSLQTVTVTGVDDPQPVQDGPQVYKITGVSSSTDGKYNNLVTTEVNLTNLDNDSAGIQISPTFTTAAPGITTEAGTPAATFTVVLNSVPANPVSFTVTSLNTAEGTVAPGTLNFTAANWNAPQTVTVTGVDDKVADGNVQYKVRLSGATSADVNYSGKFGIDLPFSNTDNDQAGYVINAATNPLITSESGLTATFTVALQSQPTAAVTIGLKSSNTGEGTVLPASLSFAPAVWNVPQTVTITGVDDSPKVADGTQAYTIVLANAASTDTSYNLKFTQTVAVNNLDNDTPGFIVTGASGLHTSENPAASPATFTVSLATQPVGSVSVTLPISSSNTKEGTVSPSPLVFSAANGFSQMVSVAGFDDLKQDGNQTYTIQFGTPTSTDAGYAKASPPPPVTMVNDDNDTIGVSVTPQSCSTTPGTTAMFSVVLNTQPGADVTIGLSSDTPSEGLVTSSPSLVFTMDNWNVAQFVTVTGQDDMTMMSAVTQYKIIATNASSPGDTSMYTYDGANVPDVTCTNTTTAPPATP